MPAVRLNLECTPAFGLERAPGQWGGGNCWRFISRTEDGDSI
jgi:hypothetical protein